MKRSLVLVALLIAGCGVQPTEPIGGSRAKGAVIYLVQDGEVTPVLRPTRHESSQLSALELLAQGVPPGGLYTTEVPHDLGPKSVDDKTVAVTVDVTTLSTMAVAQIVCTAAAPGPVTLQGGGQTRGPVSCPD
ncbi:hypothetical protein ALI144C_52175 [Actinosynnema sp. ALI-1.44]|uniref:hypothetical protein n=1 Tax=Actinosynnema sp. ALI-1.44 TaxID=1933779 RepID=UPI00097BD47F|nr:hypothetical protein [Actinosynnema sp. ALI-1.44]ONI71107.1 hypothetical protein ALI144C_52175 [Actinosynnema sp. ALI-1.44]